MGAQEDLQLDEYTGESDLSAGQGVTLDDLLEQSLETTLARTDFSGVFVGILASINELGGAEVEIPNLGRLAARCTVAVSDADLSKEVAVMFEQGDPTKPLLMGIMQQTMPRPQQVQAQMDNERLTLSADREIVLKCGKASITLTRAGKILLRGAYLFSRSSGVNRIKGGSVQIN